MASPSTRRFKVPLSRHDSGLSTTDHSWDVMKGGGNGAEDEAAASLDNEDSASCSITADDCMTCTSTSTGSSEWVMLASIGSMFPDLDDDDNNSDNKTAGIPLGTAEQNQASRPPDAESHRACHAVSLLEEDSLARLYQRLETQRERLREAFPQPLAIPGDLPRWRERQRQRQLERRADEDSLRVLAYWTARRERAWGHDMQGRACGAAAGSAAGAGGGDCSDAASLRRLEYWTERAGVARGATGAWAARTGAQPWKRSRVRGVGKEGS